MANVLLCPLETGLDKDEKFQEFKKFYSHLGYTDNDLMTILQIYREKKDLAFDFYPVSEDERKDFTDFLVSQKQSKEKEKPTVTKDSLTELYKTITTLYPPKVLNNRINRIALLFDDFVTKLVGKSTFGVSRQQAIKAMARDNKNGFDVILGRVFDYIKSLSTLDGEVAWYKHRNPSATDEQVESMKPSLQKRADEFAKMYNNRESLAALAAIKIGSSEGFAVSVDGLEYKFDNVEQLESLSDDTNEEKGTDTEESQKGDRYVDYRTLSLSETINADARRLLSRMYITDRKGEIVRDDLGYPAIADMKQAIISLHKVLQVSTPETMFDDIKAAVGRYPWMRSLVKHLDANPDDKTIIYDNFKRTRSLYVYGHKNKKKGGQISVRQINNVADGKGLSREAGSNLTNGSMADERLSIVTQDGKLQSKEQIEAIRGAVDSLSSLGLKAKDQSSKPGVRNYTVEDSASDWKDQVNTKQASDFSALTDVLRGLGLAVSDEDVKYAIANSAPIAKITGTRKDGTTSYDSSLDRIAQTVKEILDRADYIIDSKDDVTGFHLYNYAQDKFSELSDILAVIQKEEAEERSISHSKSLATATSPNALHELVDFLSNIRGLSDAEYRQQVMEKYGQFEGMSLGFGDNLQLVGWLNDLVNDGREGSDASYKTKRKSFKAVDFTDFTDIIPKDFAKLTSAEHAVISYVMYKRGTENRTSEFSGHLYEVPIQADYETAYNFICAPSYSYNELVERIAQEVECEAQRMAAISERRRKDNPDKITRALQGSKYEERGIQFMIFPELNLNGFIQKYKNADPVAAHNLVLSEVNAQLRKLLASENEKLRDFGFFSKDNMKLAGISSAEDKSINEWLLNSMYARLQVTKLMYGGLEHFKSTTDFEKRNMYSHATRLPLYTKATYRGEQVGRDNQRAMYFADDEVKSSVYDHIVRIADKLHKQGKITKSQADNMKEAYKSITTTDGQGVRTLPSMRAIKIMAGIWTDADEVAYQHIMRGNYGPADVQHFMTGFKPVYTGYEIIPAQPGKYQKPVRVPVLHKYSEMILLPEMLEDSDPQTGTTPFRAMNLINKQLGKGNEIDLFIFGSGVKVGAHSILAPFAKDKNGDRILKNSKQIAKFVMDNVKEGSFWIHTLPLQYYGLASSMHADVVDETIASATQAEKETYGNILSDEKITVRDLGEIPATEGRSLFYKIKAARTVDTFKKLTKRLSDKREVAKILKEELGNKSYKSRDLLFALQNLDNGTYAYPLYSPNLQHDVTSLLSSIIKKAFTKVPTAGANMTQTTSLGFDAELVNKAFDNESSIPGFDTLGLKFDDKDNFLYSEAIVPITNSYLAQFADENGNITPERLDRLVKEGYIQESSLYFVCYRTPSDAEHSIIPCKIKGFVANVAGASIRLPREIMKMTGHDYDGDKMRCHFKAMYQGWNQKKIYQDFQKFSNTEALNSILSQNDDPTLVPYEVFRRNVTSELNPDSSHYRAVKEIKYDWKKTPLENIGKDGSYDALNNAMVDLMFAQLTSENGGLKMFIPGGCAETVEYANTIGTRANQQEVITPFATTHATESHDYMMEGAGMIGIYALYNSAAAMFQRLNLSYVSQKDKKGEPITVSFFGKTVGDLFPVLSGEGENSSFNSLGMSRLLNAAVDNGKDPLLGYLDQTASLAHITNFLSAAGLEEGEIHLLFNQPVIKELAQALKSADDSKVPEIMSGMIDKIYANHNVKPKSDAEAVRRVATLSKSNLSEYLNKPYASLVLGDSNGWQDQVAILQTMRHINSAARDLEQFTKLTRPESNAGGIDSSIGGIISKLIQLDKFRERLVTSESDLQPVRISGMDEVLKKRDIYASSMTPQMIMDELGDQLPEVVALNSLMKDSILDFLSPYFPQARDSWMRVTRRIADQYSYDRLPGSVAERITNDMILYKLLQNPAFIPGNPYDEQKRIVEDTPKALRELRRRIEEAKKNPGTDKAAELLADNIFLNNLDLGATLNAENEAIDRIRFKMNGATLEDTADTIRASWSEMLYTGDESIKQLALDLFKYNMFTNGFSFGRYEFAHFAPVDVVLGVPGYKEALDSVLNADWTKDDEDMFFNQYIMNHWGDKNLLKTFTPDKLPMDVREQFGFKGTVSKPVDPDVFSALVGDSKFILVRTVSSGQSTDNLYMVERDRDYDGNELEYGNIIALIPVSKLGLRNRSQQVMVQYNPRIRSITELKPIFASNTVAWESAAGSLETDDASDEVSTETTQETAPVDDTPVPEITAEQVKDFVAQVKKANKHNKGILSNDQIAAMAGLEELEGTEEPEVQQSELDEIKSKSLADGTFMKAPNGKDTNLTEKQWLQVRTKAFKDWFGDWENDNENASKVVDENGEPLVVYHSGTIEESSSWDFLKEKDPRYNYKFHEGFIGTSGNSAFGALQLGLGFYFGSYTTAREFGTPKAFFLNIRKPVIAENASEIADYAYDRQRYVYLYPKKSEGYDGTIVGELNSQGLELTAYYPNQIKSATNNNGDFSTIEDDVEYYLIQRDENDNLSLGTYAETPYVIDQVRAQQAFQDLHESLDKLFKDSGVRQGVLEDAEAKAMAGGVTQFQAARIVGEEAKALIRLSTDPEVADRALPEECAHLALEMLGGHRVLRDADGNITEFKHENKLVERLLNYLNKNQRELEDAFGGQYEQYEKAYNDNHEKLIKEAAGKLVAKQWFLQQYAKTPATKNLIQRIIEAIKRFFQNPVWSIRKINDAIFGADQIASQLAKDLITGKLADEMSLDKISVTDKFYNLSNDISNKEDILSKLLKTTVKRFDILSKRLKYQLGKGASSAALDATKKQLDKLKAQMYNTKLEIVVTGYLKDTMDFMSEMEKTLDDYVNNKPVNIVCRKLRVVRDNLYSYSSIVKDVNDAIASGELSDDANLKEMIKNVNDNVTTFWSKYNYISQLYLEKTLANVYGEDGVTINVGKDKGKKVTIDEMAHKAGKDISWTSRMVNALSDCGDFVLQAVDKITRDAKQNARDRVRSMRPKLEAAFAALVKEQGNRDQSWMFERDAKTGKRTGRYISKEDAQKLSKARQDFYNVFMDLKHEADSCLPEPMISERKIIMFRKEHYEKMREAQNLKGKVGEEWENAKRSILEMDSSDFDKSGPLEDFEGNIVDLLPVKFLNKTKKETYDDMTEDAATSLMAYLGMAEEYREMNNVIGILENLRYASSMRDVTRRKGLKDIMKKFGNEKDVHYTEPMTVKQAKTNIQKVMNDFFTMHVYGHLQKDEGTFGKSRISKRKTANLLAGYTSLGQMAFNIHQRIANVNTGGVQILVEAAGREFKVKDVIWASGVWMKEAGAGGKDYKSRMAETGKTDYSNKLSLWLDKFDIHQDNGKDTRTTKYGKSDVSRSFNSGLMYAGLTIGEDYLSGTTALAFARNFKMIGPNGEESNLWDAYEVKYLDKTNKTGAYLALKEGYKKADGTELTAADERKFQNKIIATNFELQGIYNTDDRSAGQMYSLGALAFMYRKWIAPALKRRYAGVKYSGLKDDFTQGYYRTTLDLAGNIAKDWFTPVSEDEAKKTVFEILTDFRSLLDAITLNWNKLTDYEKGNCKKSFREMGIMLGLVLASGLLKNLPPDDHEGNEFLCWADQMAMSQLFRLRSEIGSQAPTPMLVSEALRIGSSPFPAMRPILDTLRGVNLLWIPNYFEEIESGRYKGHSKAYKYFRRLPIIAFFNKIDNVVDPSSLINYYKYQNY